MTYLQAVFWQDMKRGEHRKVIMRKETKRIGRFFFSPLLWRGKKFIREYICVGICIAVVPETVVCVLIRKAVNKLMCM